MIIPTHRRTRVAVPRQDRLFAPDRLPRKGHLRSPLLRKILPPRILRLDQSNLLRSRPSLQLLLPSNCFVNIVKALVIHQPVASIFAGEPFDVPALMFQCSPVNAVSHSNVKRSRAAADDVNKILVILHGAFHSCHPERSEWFAKRSIHAVEGPLTTQPRHGPVKEFQPRLDSTVRTPSRVRFDARR